MELLWTDKCFWFVLIAAGISIAYSARKEPVRASMRRITRRPLAVGAGVVVLFFLTIALLDSVHIHFTVSTKENLVKSEQGTVLDWILYPLGSYYEKTYSAPMALRLYTSETRVISGKVQQVYPPVTYTTIKPDDHAARNAFIYQSLGKSLLYTLGVLIFLYGIFAGGWRYFYGKWYRPKSVSANAFWGALAFMLFLCFSLFFLSRQLHVLGTGKIGQDILYYTIKSIRTGLVIGLLTTLIMLPLALMLGIAAGYFGGLTDDVIQYVYTTLSSIPGVLLISASVLSMQTFIANHPEFFPTLASSADARLFALCVILGITSWTSLCRLLRAEVLKLREVDYVQAAIALGSNSFTIIVRHLLPNVMHIVIITLVLDFSFLVLAEAVLSYVGVGVSPMTISWGNMINGARLELAREPLVWWPMLAAFLFMFVLVLCGNLFADAVRDAFDPHHAHL